MKKRPSIFKQVSPYFITVYEVNKKELKKYKIFNTKDYFIKIRVDFTEKVVTTTQLFTFENESFYFESYGQQEKIIDIEHKKVFNGVGYYFTNDCFSIDRQIHGYANVIKENKIEYYWKNMELL